MWERSELLTCHLLCRRASDWALCRRSIAAVLRGNKETHGAAGDGADDVVDQEGVAAANAGAAAGGVAGGGADVEEAAGDETGR